MGRGKGKAKAISTVTPDNNIEQSEGHTVRNVTKGTSKSTLHIPLLLLELSLLLVTMHVMNSCAS